MSKFITTDGFNGSVVPRFKSSGLHPGHMKNWISNNQSLTNLGPGTYNANVPSNCSMAKNKEFQSSWRRSLYLEKQSQLPCFLSKHIFVGKREKQRNMAPGKYKIKSFIEEMNQHDSAPAMRSKSCRFRESATDSIPGPGTYGKMGIPDQSLYEANQRRKHSNTVGLLSWGGKGEREIFHRTDNVGPGIYKTKSSVKEALNKTTGTRNIYDCNSIPRFVPIKTGYFATLTNHDLCPGDYKQKEFIQELGDKFHKYKGKFLKQIRNPSKPHERVFYEDPANVPVDANNQISPATYSPRSTNLLKCSNSCGTKFPFNLSTARMDAIAENNFLGNNNPYTGPGRYKVQNTNNQRFVPAAKSAFKSQYKTYENNEKYLSVCERIRPVNEITDPNKKISHHATESNACFVNDLIQRTNIKLH